ncbi:hypothetical protein AB6T85_01035 [Erwinia sp. ACCC 02193]|uniref:Uncharacterized protein n=1 Tax=Erwinia aeris TaxID=3239803 RepID=A0ABV4E2A5_9GAMM
MLSTLERWVSFYEFKVKPSHDEAPFLPFADVVQKMQSLYNQGNAFKMSNNDTRAMRISDMNFNQADNCVTLLVQLCDTRMADPVFGDLNSGALREEPKLAGEGIAVSAHFLISCNPTHNSADHYKALVECVPGITKSSIEPFLNYIFRKSYYNEEFTSPLSGSVYKLRPVLDLFSHASETLEESLLGSRLQGVRLVSTSKQESMDKNPYTDMVEKAIKLKIVKQPGVTGRKRLLASLRGRAVREGYNKLVISYSKDGKQTSVDLDVREDAATKLFTKMEKIILPDGIKQCEPSIHGDMEARMKRML